MFTDYVRNMESAVSIVIRFHGRRPRVVVQFAPETRGCSLFQSVQPSVEPNDFPICSKETFSPGNKKAEKQGRFLTSMQPRN
jgi:hypothetical protein